MILRTLQYARSEGPQGVADFLAEPYKGSDAYETHDGLMAGMVSTFKGADLKMKK